MLIRCLMLNCATLQLFMDVCMRKRVQKTGGVAGVEERREEGGTRVALKMIHQNLSAPYNRQFFGLLRLQL